MTKKISKDWAGNIVFTCKEPMNLDDGDLPDEALVGNARSGDARSFEVLFDRYYDMIHAFAYRVCLVETEADDIAQETFIRAARGLVGYRATASFKNWLYRIAHNLTIDWGCRAARYQGRLTELAAGMESLPPRQPKNYDEVHGALRKLPPELREAMALVYLDGMNHREAAAVMGCAETTVSWRIFRAKRALRKLLTSTRGEWS
jgi:RNA polymerase sigma-70 factor (ECF subfamily)